MNRVGLGYDSHRFAEAEGMTLGGVWIPCGRGLHGHSDADAVLHAVTDAILGALAEGDIGDRFPDTDPAWAGADSAGFVTEAMGLARQAGYVCGNCDVTVLAQTPRLGPHKADMRAGIARLLGVDDARVSVKAKTNEHMGFVGRSEGLAVLAIVNLVPA
jgi:2-C-methyl-D-erythritol 2,4-cyclodiphosphate synthase